MKIKDIKSGMLVTWDLNAKRGPGEQGNGPKSWERYHGKGPFTVKPRFNSDTSGLVDLCQGFYNLGGFFLWQLKPWNPFFVLRSKRFIL